MMMMNRADESSKTNANAPAPWTQSPPSPQGLPSRRPHEGEYRPLLGGPRIFRHPRGGRGEAGPSNLLVTAVEDAPQVQIHNTVHVLVGTKNLLTLVHVPIRAEHLATTLLKETSARLCVKHVGRTLLFPMMADQRLDDSRDTTHGPQVDQILAIDVVQGKVATGNTGFGTRAMEGIEALHQNLSHHESAV